MKNVAKFGLIFLIIGIIAAFYHFGLVDYLTLESIQENRQKVLAYYQENSLLVIAAYFLIYVITTAVSIPGAAFLTLAGGAIFGAVFGTGIIVFSASVGASLAFLSSRFIFRDTLEGRYQGVLDKFNTGLAENAFLYILSIRLIPLFPFFIVNLVFGLTRVRVVTFFMASIIGMAPGTFVYANAGRQLSTITSTADIASPRILGAFALLGVFALIPVVFKKIKGKSDSNSLGGARQ